MSAEQRAAVFFDRDGVLIEAVRANHKPRCIDNVADLVFTRDAEAVCAELRALGVPLFVFTNQPDIGRGLTPRTAVEAINAVVSERLGIEAVAMAESGDDADPLRKPNPGMLLKLAMEHGLNLRRSVAVGDRWRDVEAGRRAGVRTLFIDRGWDERAPTAPDAIVAELGDGLPWIRAQLGLLSWRGCPAAASCLPSHCATIQWNSSNSDLRLVQPIAPSGGAASAEPASSQTASGVLHTATRRATARRVPPVTSPHSHDDHPAPASEPRARPDAH